MEISVIVGMPHVVGNAKESPKSSKTSGQLSPSRNKPTENSIWESKVHEKKLIKHRQVGSPIIQARKRTWSAFFSCYQERDDSKRSLKPISWPVLLPKVNSRYSWMLRYVGLPRHDSVSPSGTDHHNIMTEEEDESILCDEALTDYCLACFEQRRLQDKSESTATSMRTMRSNISHHDDVYFEAWFYNNSGLKLLAKGAMFEKLPYSRVLPSYSSS